MCERPVAACSTPSGSGTARAGGKTPPGLRLPILGQVCQPLTPVFFNDACAGSSSSASIAGVAHSSAVWLAEGGTLSTGFTPQGMPYLDACCVPLTPLSTRSSLRERSLLPLKGAPSPKNRRDNPKLCVISLQLLVSDRQDASSTAGLRRRGRAAVAL